MTIEAHPAQIDRALCQARRRCEDQGITVTFDPQAPTAYTNGQGITIPAVGMPITVDSLDTLYGQIIHETGHHLRDDAFRILKAAKPPEHLCALFNIAEDDGMERAQAKEHKGDAIALSKMNEVLIRLLDSKWREQADALNGDPAPMACLALNQLSRLEWDTISEAAASQFIKAMPDKVKELIAELESEGWVHRLRATETPHDTWDVAVDLAKRLYGDTPEKEEQYEEIREAGHSMQGERDDSKDIVGPEEKDDADVTAAVPTAGEQCDEGASISWKDVVLSEHNEWDSKEEGNLGISWDGYNQTEAAIFAPTSEINVVDLGKSKADSSYYMRYMASDKESGAFANKIRRYIQAQARTIVDPEKRYGMLDRGALHRLAMPPIDGGEWNKKVFYEQRNHKMKDTCIFVLVDWSGSMNGTKMQYAADAAQRLVWCFDRVLNVPVGLAAFSDGQSFCDIGYIKPWNTRGMNEEEIARRFARFKWYTSANNDGDALHWAYLNILKRKERRKILIVLSDGCPTRCYASSWAGGDSTLLKIAETIDKDTRVDLSAVGICDDSVARYYQNYQVIRTAQEITPALFNIIKEGDKRHGR